MFMGLPCDSYFDVRACKHDDRPRDRRHQVEMECPGTPTTAERREGEMRERMRQPATERERLIPSSRTQTDFPPPPALVSFPRPFTSSLGLGGSGSQHLNSQRYMLPSAAPRKVTPPSTLHHCTAASMCHAACDTLPRYQHVC